MKTKPTKFNREVYDAKQAALKSLRDNKPAGVNSIPALRDRLLLLEKVVGV